MIDEVVVALEDALGFGDTSASHVHLRIAEIRGLRFRESPDRNAALDVLGPDASAVLSISFRRTSPSRVESLDPERLPAVRSRFRPVAGVPA